MKTPRMARESHEFQSWECQIAVKPRFEDGFRISYSKTEITDSIESIQHPIIREALKLVGSSNTMSYIHSRRHNLRRSSSRTSTSSKLTDHSIMKMASIVLHGGITGSGRADLLKLDFPGLLAIRRRGYCNGNWSRLPLVDRALFRCALWVAKVRRRIENLKLLVKVSGIALKLLTTRCSRILRAGSARAAELLRRYEESGVFEWAPELRGWLKDVKYILYLGMEELSRR